MHLFRVAAGLDSLVPGEGEILGQVRTAFEAGAAGPLLDRLFRQALHAGTRARVETAIGESPASVPAAAAALAQQVFDDLRGRSGAARRRGQDQRADGAQSHLARCARSRPSRTGRATHGAELAGSSGREAVALDAVGGELASADIVVSSTSAPGLVLSRGVRSWSGSCAQGRPLLFVDLAVPRDLDPADRELDGCFLYDVDDLEAVVTRRSLVGAGEAARAERVVAEEAERFREWQASLDVVPAIASLRARRRGDPRPRARQGRRRLGGCRSASGERVESVTSQIVEQAPAFAHGPVERGSCGSRRAGLC